MAKFDDCAKTSASKDFVDTAKTGGLVPSVAHGMAISPRSRGRCHQGRWCRQFWNDDKISVADAHEDRLAAAAMTK